jgi:predicted metal-dependent HD superfamily phosphohydrolase
MKHKDLIEQAAKYVSSIFDEHPQPELLYHNKAHTKAVVDAATQIANHYQLSEHDFFIVITAAWFHDTGQLFVPVDHENKSAELATEFLTTHKVDAASIQKIKDCILATRMPQKPTNQLENIICDADLFHFGTTEFSKKNKLMREEYNATHNEKKVSKADWRAETIKLLENHRFHTDYCRFLLDEQQQKNLEALKSKAREAENEQAANDNAGLLQTSGEQSVASVTATKSKKERPDKGIETMFRVSSSNHSRLSDMADNKAHILITVNSIILSAVISLVLRKLDNNSFLTMPSFILLTVSLITIIFAILATRPSIPRGEFTQEQIEQKKVNLLFFGNFFRMSLTDYTNAMKEVMDDREFLYDNLIKDIYFQGIVLGKKYRLLRIAYNVFMFGLSVSVIAYIVSSAMAAKHTTVNLSGFAGFGHWRSIAMIWMFPAL